MINTLIDMTKDEELMKRWERLFAEGENVNVIFGANDINTIVKHFREMVIVKAFRRYDYNVSTTSRMLGIKSRVVVSRIVNKYIPDYKELKHELALKRRRESRKQRYLEKGI